MLRDRVVHIWPEVVLEETLFSARHTLVTGEEGGVRGMDDVVDKRKREEKYIAMRHVMSRNSVPKNISFEETGGRNTLNIGSFEGVWG
jgi:hypothetical protein